ncbi:hypothetical protein GCM10010317_101400 [Streptomyces mirabilis]|uniref:hypothetical protein n=1 Tax=Streptomyces mirabilis TaxID=68239 RepID=UPI00167C5C3A|nr:hypothetical protein [Streptomyces mirabilis]GHD79986.1 hypothetical protein GCM10010317_101400 [Streptomyces mirabilis]
MGVRTWVSDWPVYRQLTGADPLARGRGAMSAHTRQLSPRNDTAERVVETRRATWEWEKDWLRAAWTEACRYMRLDLLTKVRLHPIESETDETALPTELTAQPQNEIPEWPSIHHSNGRDPYPPGENASTLSLGPCRAAVRRPDGCMG